MFCAVAVVAIAACASDAGPSTAALDADEARSRLAAACAATTERLDALTPPDDAGRAAWTRDVATILGDEAADVGGLVLLDGEQRDAFRDFAANTTEQSAAWSRLADLLGTGADLTGDDRVADLTTEIAELSLGRDDLSDELAVAACRRGSA